MKKILVVAAGLAAASATMLAPQAQADSYDTGVGTVYYGGNTSGGYVILDGSTGDAPGAGQGYIGGSASADGVELYGACESDDSSGEDTTEGRNRIDQGDSDPSSCA